jgi:hypothetical protein
MGDSLRLTRIVDSFMLYVRGILAFDYATEVADSLPISACVKASIFYEWFFVRVCVNFQ